MRSRLPLVLIVVAIAAAGWWQSRERDAAGSATPPSHVEVDGPLSGAPGRADVAPEARDVAPYSLAKDERRGGHTLARHVGRTDQELLDRLRRESNISAASTYTDRLAAERTIARTLAREQPRVDKWLARSGNRPNLALDYRGLRDDVIGRSIERGARDAVPCTDAVVVLRWDGQDGYYVLTSYPEAR